MKVYQSFGHKAVILSLKIDFLQIDLSPLSNMYLMDQVYFLDQKNELDLEIDRYSPYYSDHDAILITLSQR